MVRRAGVLAPLFSLYSKQSVGIGEFEDLKLLVDWCSKIGASIVQLLPMNEMGALSCPYDSISSFALDPVYASLRMFPQAAKGTLKKTIEELKKTYPAGSQYVDYQIKTEKMRLLWGMFSHDTEANTPAFKDFVRDNHYWIDDYALYKIIKDNQNGKPWYEWDEPYKNRDAQALERFKKEYFQAFQFHQWVQWHSYEQFKSIKAYATARAVLLKGDLPILVSRDSVDVWAHQEFFKLELASGAPPDMYCAKGQRWGMPPYNWPAIAVKKYRYMKEKLRYAESFYDILRIDHVVGLFRIWCIPVQEPMVNQGLNGFFDPSDEHQWEHHGRTILKHMMEETPLSYCAEDLGVIPRVCTDTLKDLRIPGIDVQRWVKDWDKTHDFLTPQEYRKLSVAVLSTHDTPNWAAWWENEAGTVDEAGFICMCAGRGISYDAVKKRLFDEALSKHGRLRWLPGITSVDAFAAVLGKPHSEIKDFIGAYLNTYREKEKLWEQLKMKGHCREKADAGLIRAALAANLQAQSLYSIQLIIDWLYAAEDVFDGDPYQYTINRPGTISQYNWSLRLPLSLEALLSEKVNPALRKMVEHSGRVPHKEKQFVRSKAR